MRTIREGHAPVGEDEEDDGDVRKRQANADKTSPRQLPREKKKDKKRRKKSNKRKTRIWCTSFQIC